MLTVVMILYSARGIWVRMRSEPQVKERWGLCGIWSKETFR